MIEYLERCGQMVWDAGARNDSFWQSFGETVRDLSSDRRYRVKLRAASIGYRPTGIFTYHGVKYDLYHDYPVDRIVIQRMAW